MRKLFRIICFTGILFSFTCISFGQNKEEILSDYFNKAILQWNVPGMAVGIIHNNSTVLLEGYGVRETGRPKKVDGNTVFAVASNTKSFTATAIGILIDEGKLNWDDKVIDHLPWFRLYDPYVTEHITIRDLLSHRSGLVTFSGDLIWYGSIYNREEIVRRAAFLKPGNGFREKFGYSNIMYLAAGLIVEKVSGLSWDEFINERILIPLNMNNTFTSVNRLDLKGNTAIPHNAVNDSAFSIHYLNWDNIGPAGSLNSSAADMLKWLQLQLGKGTINGKTIISEKRLREMYSPQTIQNVSPFSERTWPSTHFKSYGLGWSMMDYHGRKVISHSGGYDGMISYTCFVPEENLGFVILTNQNSSLYYPLAYKILDTYLSDSTTDWSDFFLNLQNSAKEDEEMQKKNDSLSFIPGTTPSLALKDFAGTYHSIAYGDVVVELRKDKLHLQFVPSPMFSSNMVHWQYNTFTIKFDQVPSLPEGKAAFIINEGKAEKILIDVPNPDFDFTELEFNRL